MNKAGFRRSIEIGRFEQLTGLDTQIPSWTLGKIIGEFKGLHQGAVGLDVLDVRQRQLVTAEKDRVRNNLLYVLNIALHDKKTVEAGMPERLVAVSDSGLFSELDLFGRLTVIRPNRGNHESSESTTAIMTFNKSEGGPDLLIQNLRYWQKDSEPGYSQDVWKVYPGCYVHDAFSLIQSGLRNLRGSLPPVSFVSGGLDN